VSLVVKPSRMEGTNSWVWPSPNVEWAMVTRFLRVSAGRTDTGCAALFVGGRATGSNTESSPEEVDQ